MEDVLLNIQLCKIWNTYCKHYIFYLLYNNSAAYVYFTTDDGSRACSRERPGAKTRWHTCSVLVFKSIKKRYTVSNELEFLLITGHSVRETLRRDGFLRREMKKGNCNESKTNNL